eukprot:766893-Ditylum_brightwellii.AAC.1
MARRNLKRVALLIYKHLRRFGPQMHITKNGKEAKTEVVAFPALGIEYRYYDMSNIEVAT